MAEPTSERVFKANSEQSQIAKNSQMDLHSRVSVLEQQIIDQKEATVIALAAADKAIVNAVVVADKAVAKVELAAEKTYLEASILGLKEAFGQMVEHQKELTSQALASADKAVLKAEVAAEKRFESVNEFRATLSDQQRELATKTEVDLRITSLEARLNMVVEDSREMKGRGVAHVENRTEQSTDKGQMLVTISIMIALGALIFSVVMGLRGH